MQVCHAEPWPELDSWLVSASIFKIKTRWSLDQVEGDNFAIAGFVIPGSSHKSSSGHGQRQTIAPKVVIPAPEPGTILRKNIVIQAPEPGTILKQKKTNPLINRKEEHNNINKQHKAHCLILKNRFFSKEKL